VSGDTLVSMLCSGISQQILNIQVFLACAHLLDACVSVHQPSATPSQILLPESIAELILFTPLDYDAEMLPIVDRNRRELVSAD